MIHPHPVKWSQQKYESGVALPAKETAALIIISSGTQIHITPPILIPALSTTFGAGEAAPGYVTRDLGFRRCAIFKPRFLSLMSISVATPWISSPCISFHGELRAIEE